MFFGASPFGSSNQSSVPNPQVPFNGEIQNGLQPGKQVIIKAQIHPHCQDFRVDFLTHSNNIALHINPRFTQGQIVRNSNLGVWGPEERHGGFPFQRGAPFEMIVAAESDHFKVSVNGQNLFEYRHRVPLQEISRLAVDGQINCHAITFVGGSARGHEVHNPPVPSTVPIHNGLNPGKLIQINGVVPHHAGRFEINVQSGGENESGNVGLHFNPRWNDPYSPQPITIRTNRQHGAWGQEDRQHQPPFPFQKGAPFELLILCEPQEFKVAVNGQHYISFPHRGPFQLYDNIGFGGDVVINSVKQFN